MLSYSLTIVVCFMGFCAQRGYLVLNSMKVSQMLLQYLHFLIVNLSIIFYEISCAQLDLNVYVVEENQYMYNIFIFQYG